MRSLVGRAVTVYLAEEKPPLRLEGRVDDARDGVLEVRLARSGLSGLKQVLRQTFRVELEYVESCEVWGIPCRLETYGTAFPPVLRLRPAGGARLVHRRRHERYPANIPARLVADGSAEESVTAAAGAWQEGRVVNLSQGGAAVVLPAAAARQLLPGQEVTLQFVAKELVRPRARIVRQEEEPEESLLGLAFVGMSAHDETCLTLYLEQLRQAVASALRA